MDDMTIKKIAKMEREIERLKTADAFDGAFAGWASTNSAKLNLPGVVGYWPGSVTDLSGTLIDGSGGGNNLTSSSTINTTVGIVPCVYYNGSARHYHADGNPFDIIGTETSISSSYRGLTIGCWVRHENTASAFEVISGKWGAGGNSYKLQRTDAGKIQFAIYDGASSYTVTSTATAGALQWKFVIGRYDPSTAIDVIVNDETTTNTTSIPASLNNSTSTFTAGSQDAGALPMTGWARGLFLAAFDIPDDYITNHFNLTRSWFGV